MSGCVCPSGLVSDGKGGCIAENLCPCFHNGVAYQPGESIKTDCNTWYVQLFKICSYILDFMYGIIFHNELAFLFFIVLVRIDDGPVPQTSAVGHAASMEMAIIKRLMRKDTSLVETANTALFRY